MAEEYGRTRSQTKKAREAAGGSAPSASPTRLTGAFDDEADSAAGAAAVQPTATPRQTRQRQPPRLTSGNTNTNRSATSGTPGRTTASSATSSARKKKASQTPRRAGAESESDQTVPAAGTIRGPYKDRQNLNFPQGLAFAYALCDPEVQSIPQFAKAWKYDNRRHIDMTENAPPGSKGMGNLRDAWAGDKPIRTNPHTLSVARLMVEADLREKAAANKPLSRKEKIVAAALGGEAKFGFGAAPTAGVGAPGAVGVGAVAGIGAAGGIPAGFGEGGGGGGAVAAGAAAAGEYGHGYAGGVGIGGGIGAGAGIMGNGARAGAAIGGALNIIPPSPSAGGGVVGTPHAAGTPIQDFAQMMLEQRREDKEQQAQQRRDDQKQQAQQRRDDQKQQAQQRREDEERRMKFEAEQMERQRQFQREMQAQQLENQAQQQERLDVFQAQQQERQNNFEAGMQERQEERQNAFQAEQQQRQFTFEAGVQDRQNNFEAGMQERQQAFEAKHSLVLERVLDRLDEQRQVGEKLQAQQARTDKRVGDHLVRYENDKEKLGAELADVIKRLATLEKGSDEKKLLDTMLDGRKLQEQDGNEEEDAAVEMPPAFDLSVATNSASIGTIAYEDTKPAPREEIEAQAKKGIIKSSRLNKQLVSNVIFEYANDYGINSRRRRKMTCERDEEFLVLSKLVLKAIPPYPFHDFFVYRCINMTQEHAIWFQQQMASGKPFTELAFTSACAFSPKQQNERKDLTNKFHIMNTYIAIRSKSGRLVKKYTKGYEDEWEVLFCYDTTFRILSFEDTRPGEEHEVGTRGRFRIVMEEVSSRIPGLDLDESRRATSS